MYKLLTTTAIVLAVATPTLANDWKNAKDLTNNLNTIYGALDGKDEFDALQTGGELANFFSEVDKGVTHVTLTVDPVTNNITTGIVPGSTFAVIQEKQVDLVNRINYDLFASEKNEAGDAYITSYESTTDYTSLKGQGFTIDGDPADSADNNFNGSQDKGLAGFKITKLVDNVNLANDYLIAGDRSATESQNFITAWGNKTGVVDIDGNEELFGGSSIATINSDITDLNLAINTAQDSTATPVADSNSGFFGNIDFGALEDANVNSFLIPSYNSATDIGAVGIGGYTSISNWASEIQSVTVGDKTGTVNTAGTITVVDEAAGTISDGTDTFTWDAATSTFTK